MGRINFSSFQQSAKSALSNWQQLQIPVVVLYLFKVKEFLIVPKCLNIQDSSLKHDRDKFLVVKYL